MPWTKQPDTKTAKVGNEDLRASFAFRGGSPGDPDAEPPVDPTPAALTFSLHVEHEDGSAERINVPVTGALTAPQETSLKANLVRLRDAALAALGYTQT